MEIENMDYRHGDVGLVRISKIPSTAKRCSGSKRVLAEGETTGHKHVMQGKDVVFYEDNGQVMVQVENEAELTHEEHGKIEVDAGTYLVVKQVDVSPLQVVRLVRD